MADSKIWAYLSDWGGRSVPPGQGPYRAETGAEIRGKLFKWI